MEHSLTKRIEGLSFNVAGLVDRRATARAKWVLLRMQRKEARILSKRLDKVQRIIQEVAQETQKQLQFHIAGIVTMALEAVFPDPYEFKLEFELKRGKTEADLLFKRDGRRVDPMTASGCGAVDVASFALRVACWSLRRPRSRAVLVFDEPFKNLSADLQEKAGEMVKMVSEKLCIQMIIVTHQQELVEVADKVYRVTKPGKYSIVRKEGEIKQ